MKRVLIISNMYPSKLSKTYGVFVKNQVDQLREHGVAVDVVAIKNPRRGKFQTIKKHINWVIKVLYYLAIKGRKYDVVHAHYIFPSGWLALLFKRFFNTKVVVTSHGGDIDQMPHKGKFLYKQTKRTLHEANSIISVGEQLKQEMINEFKVDDTKITVLNMGVNREIFIPQNKQEAKKHLQLSKETVHLLFVGNIIKSKGIIELLEAYSTLRRDKSNIQLHIIGSIVDQQFKGFIDEKIRKNDISDVIFHEPMNQQNLADWMAAADVFVLPSHIEGFGLVALEAMSTHTPVVGTRVGGLQYLLQDDAGMLVDAGSAVSLRNGIQQLIFDDELRKRLINNGEKKARRYDQKEILNELLTIYDFKN